MFIWLTKKTSNGTITIANLSNKEGKAILIKDGFCKCRNKNYFQKDDTLIHYNSKMKVWIKEPR